MARRKNTAEAFEIFRKIAQREAEARKRRLAETEGTQVVPGRKDSEGKRVGGAPLGSSLRRIASRRSGASASLRSPLQRSRTQEAGDRPLRASAAAGPAVPAGERSSAEDRLPVRAVPRGPRRAGEIAGSAWLLRGVTTRPRPVGFPPRRREEEHPAAAPAPPAGVPGSGPARARPLRERPSGARAGEPKTAAEPEDAPVLSVELLEARDPPPRPRRLPDGDFFEPDPEDPEELMEPGGPAGGSSLPAGAGMPAPEPGGGAGLSPQSDSGVPGGGGEPNHGSPGGGGGPSEVKPASIHGWVAACVRRLGGDGFGDWLERRVELRLSTLITLFAATVVVLALVGIYLKLPGREDTFYRNFELPSPPVSGTGGSLPQTYAPPDRSAGRSGGTEAPASPLPPGRPLWSRPTAEESTPARPPRGLEEFRLIAAAGRPAGGTGAREAGAGQPGIAAAPAGGVGVREEVWIKVRSRMDRKECSELAAFLETRLLPYLEERDGCVPDSVACKAIRPVDRSDSVREDWRLYIGPFRGWDEAEAAAERLKEVTKLEPFRFKGRADYFDSAFACTGPWKN